jgi:hypothetical protein
MNIGKGDRTMKNKSRGGIIFLLALLAVAIWSYNTQGGDTAQKIEDPASVLMHEYSIVNSPQESSVEDFDKTAKEIIEYRGQIEHYLIVLLRDSRLSNDKKIRICAMMAHYRIEDIPDLAENIDLEYVSPQKEITELPLWGRYPAQQALIRIGTRSVPAMLQIIETSDNEKRRELAARVIIGVQEGSGEPALARILMEKKIEKQTDPEKKKRLEATLKYFRQ